jgi:hypothetical protein
MWASELDEATLWDAFVAGLRLVPIKRRVSLPALSLSEAAAKQRRLRAKGGVSAFAPILILYFFTIKFILHTTIMYIKSTC